jgi:hypothetical protein
MALKKMIIMPNGLPLEYHRIALVSLDINNQNTILVESYLNEEARQYEKDYAARLIEGEPIFPYTQSNYYNPPYDGVMSISRAYDWLRNNVPAFEGAENTGDVSDEISSDEFMAMLEEVL